MRVTTMLPHSTLTKGTEFVAFWAVMNLGNFGTLSMEESVLQFSYLLAMPRHLIQK